MSDELNALRVTGARLLVLASAKAPQVEHGPHFPMTLGLPPFALPVFERAACGDPDAFLELAEAALSGVERALGLTAAVAASEIPAALAAVCGGVKHRRYYADLMMRQADNLARNRPIPGRPDERQFALHQAKSLYLDIGDQEAAARADALLSEIEEAACGRSMS